MAIVALAWLLTGLVAPAYAVQNGDSTSQAWTARIVDPSGARSGALIAQQWVITADHCLYGATKATKTTPVGADKLTVYLSSGHYPVKAVRFPTLRPELHYVIR